MINKISKKRGLSSIIGTLLMVAVVATVGSVILFQGLNGINDFNFYLSFLTGSKNASLENAIVEHVNFPPTAHNLKVTVRNTGTVQLEITKITVVNLNTQELIFTGNPHTTVFINNNALIDQVLDLNLSAAGTPNWQDSPYPTYQYKISLTTALGNSFETTATPFNT